MDNEELYCRECKSRTGNLAETEFYMKGVLQIQSLIWICYRCKAQHTFYNEERPTDILHEPWRTIPKLLRRKE